MSCQSALHARTAVENAAWVVAAELVCGAQAAEFLDDDLTLGAGTAAAREAIRAAVPPLDADRPIHADLDAGKRLVLDGELQAVVEAAVDERDESRRE
jgi:histidine ammonia-lyase